MYRDIVQMPLAFVNRRRRRLIIGFLGFIVIFLLARRLVERWRYSADSNDDGYGDSGGEGIGLQSDGSGVVLDASSRDAAVGGRVDYQLSDVHQMIRSLLVAPSVGFGTAEVVNKERRGRGRRRGRRGGRRGRRRGRKGGRRGVGGGDDGGGEEEENEAAKPDGGADYSQHGQSLFVDRHLAGRRDGFYVESGASDGETGSNTLFFEIKRNWSGLLVEANPRSFTTLLFKRRRAWSLNACLSPTGKTTSARFQPAGGIGGIVDHMAPGHRKLVERFGFDDINATCFAFSDVIAALPVSPKLSRIDYWSLDVEGAELAILRSINWAAMVPIDVISVEYKIKNADGRTDRVATEEKLKSLRNLFAGTKLYVELRTINDVDIVFGRINEASSQQNQLQDDLGEKKPDAAADAVRDAADDGGEKVSSVDSAAPAFRSEDGGRDDGKDDAEADNEEGENEDWDEKADEGGKDDDNEEEGDGDKDDGDQDDDAGIGNTDDAFQGEKDEAMKDYAKIS